MERINLTPDTTLAVARLAAEVILAGGIVLHPTDTVYGLAGDATQRAVASRMAQLKQRPEDMPFIVLMANPGMLHAWIGGLTNTQALIIDRCAPGPVTFMLPGTVRTRDFSGTGGTIAVRIPDHEFTVALCRESGVPILSTSANTHGASTPTTCDAVESAIGDHVDLIVVGTCNSGDVSTMLDLTRETPRIVREGAMSRSELEQRIGLNVL